MITGRVNSDLEAIIGIDVQDSEGNLHRIECVLDTGFSGFLVLPANVIRRLGLIQRGERKTFLVDDAEVMMPSYLALTDRQGELIEISILQAEQDYLVGMALLENNTLTVQVWDGGEVRIEPR